MLDAAQTQYVEEVLGVSLRHYAHVEAQPPTHELLVVTTRLGSAELTLLKKILLSAKLSTYALMEDGQNLPAAKHILAFTASPQRGRSDAGGGTVRWNLPPLTEMLGEGEAVTDAKRRTWALLQLFMKEANS